jgi:hypothetical protein
MANELAYNAEKHEYSIDGKRIPGYSEVAKAMGITNYSGIPDYIMESARNFGTAGHYATRLWDEGRLDVNSLSLPLIPCLEAYKQMLLAYNVVIIKEYIENPICSFRYRFGTTPDRICLIEGEMSILELKFVSSLQPGIALQTAAQKLAAEEYYRIKIKNRYALQIAMDGKLRPLKPYKDKSDEGVWLNYLSAFNWKERNLK